MRLDVYVSGKHAGVLEQLAPAEFKFTYLHGADAVSLAMPVRAEPYLAPLHPVFQVSLPEGDLRAELERETLKRTNVGGDMSVLAVVGQHLVGNLSVVPEGAAPSPEAMESLADVLKHGGSPEFVAKLISEHATRSGVSGGYLKVLAETKSTKRHVPLDRKASLRISSMAVRQRVFFHEGSAVCGDHYPAYRIIRRWAGIAIGKVRCQRGWFPLRIRGHVFAHGTAFRTQVLRIGRAHRQDD